MTFNLNTLTYSHMEHLEGMKQEEAEIYEICELGYLVFKKREAVVTNEMVNQMREELDV